MTDRFRGRRSSHFGCFPTSSCSSFSSLAICSFRLPGATIPRERSQTIRLKEAPIDLSPDRNPRRQTFGLRRTPRKVRCQALYRGSNEALFCRFQTTEATDPGATIYKTFDELHFGSHVRRFGQLKIVSNNNSTIRLAVIIVKRLFSLRSFRSSRYT